MKYFHFRQAVVSFSFPSLPLFTHLNNFIRDFTSRFCLILSVLILSLHVFLLFVWKSSFSLRVAYIIVDNIKVNFLLHTVFWNISSFFFLSTYLFRSNEFFNTHSFPYNCEYILWLWIFYISVYFEYMKIAFRTRFEPCEESFWTTIWTLFYFFVHDVLRKMCLAEWVCKFLLYKLCCHISRHFQSSQTRDCLKVLNSPVM